MRRWLPAAVVAVMTVGCSEPVLTSMKIEPGVATIWQDSTVTLQVMYFDQNGGTIEPPAGGVEWSASPPTVATVEDDGTVVPVRHGNVIVTASAVGGDGEKVETTATVEVKQVHTLDVVAYITQVNQHPHEPIPLVAGRRGMFRMHAVAQDPSRYLAPEARVRLWDDNGTIADTILHQVTPQILQEVDQSTYDNSYNLEVEGDDVSEGLMASVIIDPDDNERGVKGGDTITFEVVKLDVQKQILVPVFESHDQSHDPTRSVERFVSDNAGNGDMGENAMAILPVAEQNLMAHAPYETDLNWSEDYQGSWLGLLRELDALRRQEDKRDHYYYGVIWPSQSGGIGGIAFNIGHPVSCGVPDTETYIHETGHSMNLRHAPCHPNNQDIGADPNYPNDDGFLDWWGYNPHNNRLMSPGRWTDYMGYCANTWVSAYHFGRGVVFRAGRGAYLGRPRSVLVVTGAVHDGVLTVDPVFEAVSTPETGGGGPYLIEGHGPRGQVLFSHRFTPHTPPDQEGGRIFSVAVPAPAGLESITVSGPEGAVAVTRDSHTPTAMLIDENGEVRAIRRNWDGSNPNNWTVKLSTGLPG